MRYTGKFIGSRSSQTTTYWTDKDNIQVVCGCFSGDLEAFEKQVKEVYPDESHEYYKYIKIVRTIICME